MKPQKPRGDSQENPILLAYEFISLGSPYAGESCAKRTNKLRFQRLLLAYHRLSESRPTCGLRSCFRLALGCRQLWPFWFAFATTQEHELASSLRPRRRSRCVTSWSTGLNRLCERLPIGLFASPFALRCGCGSKNRYQNGTLVSGNMDSKTRGLPLLFGFEPARAIF